MKKRLLLVLALVAALSLVAAAPVSADGEKPIEGKMDLTFFGVPCPVEPDPDPTAPFVSWIGTVVIDGTTYGWADFPPGEPVPDGNFLNFTEYWTIFDLDGEDPTVALACDPDLVVLDGNNGGRATRGWAARADGEVASAADPGPFADVDPGSRMIWRGKITSFIGEDPFEFKATLHIFPLK